ncbi:cell surface A33 antigen-like [Sardina pilchardus]|uniref:cell surface A33 antigen-like n=1 Tax=Sardina pilchardus TaxID=27697 RepID=UPI002E13B968
MAWQTTVSGLLVVVAISSSGLSLVTALTVTIPEEVYEFARGDNITLPCSFTSKVADPKPIVTWTVERDQGKEVTILTYDSSIKQLDIKSVYEGRVSLDHNIPGRSVNLKLNNIALADNKQYECKIQVPGDDEGKLTDTARLVVLVAPSPPICAVEGTEEYGQDIKLTCKSEEGSPTPTFKWQSHDVRNTPRPLPPKATDVAGVLSLFNITSETSGYYVCTSSNKIQSATCNMTLSVMPQASMNLFDPKLCYILDGFLMFYGVMITALLVKERCGRPKAAQGSEKALSGGGRGDLEAGSNRGRRQEDDTYSSLQKTTDDTYREITTKRDRRRKDDQVYQDLKTSNKDTYDRLHAKPRQPR